MGHAKISNCISATTQNVRPAFVSDCTCRPPVYGLTFLSCAVKLCPDTVHVHPEMNTVGTLCYDKSRGAPQTLVCFA